MIINIHAKRASLPFIDVSPAALAAPSKRQPHVGLYTGFLLRAFT